jgi:hypothetical protein
MLSQPTLSNFEKQAETRAPHRALIMQILQNHPEGLTTQEIVKLELECFGYTFLTDNRLRECRDKLWVMEDSTVKPVRWVAVDLVLEVWEEGVDTIK